MITKDTKDAKDTKDTIHNAPKVNREVVITTPPGLPLYLANAVWEADQQVPVMETKASKDAPTGPPPPPPVEVYLAEHVQAQLRAPDRWKATVILALVTAGIYLPVHDDDPRRALNDLLVNNALPLPHETLELNDLATTPESRRR